MDGMCQGACLMFGAGCRHPGMAFCSFMDGLSLSSTPNRSSPGADVGLGAERGGGVCIGAARQARPEHV